MHEHNINTFNRFDTFNARPISINMTLSIQNPTTSIKIQSTSFIEAWSASAYLPDPAKRFELRRSCLDHSP